MCMTALWKTLEVKHNDKPSGSFKGMVNKVPCDGVHENVPFYGHEIDGIKDVTHGYSHFMSPEYFLIYCPCLINSCWPQASVLGLSQEYLRQRECAEALRQDMSRYIGKLHMAQMENEAGFTELTISLKN